VLAWFLRVYLVRFSEIIRSFPSTIGQVLLEGFVFLSFLRLEFLRIVQELFLRLFKKELKFFWQIPIRYIGRG
jgi:hypothetical protein